MKLGIQSNSLDSSMKRRAITPLFFLASSFISIMTKRQCCVLYLCVKPHWNFDKLNSEYPLIFCWIHFRYFWYVNQYAVIFIHFDNFFKQTGRTEAYSYTFVKVFTKGFSKKIEHILLNFLQILLNYNNICIY